MVGKRLHFGGSSPSSERMVRWWIVEASEECPVADPRTDDLKIVSLGTCDPKDISAFLSDSGISRLLVEEPYVGTARGAHLLQQVHHDASRDDALALAVQRRGRFVGFVVVRFPVWDREHFGFEVGRIEHLQGADPEVLECLVDETLRQLRARGAHMSSARLSSDALAALHCLERSGFRYIELTLAPWRDLSTWDPKGFDVTRPTGTADVDRMCAIARTAFRTDRFHRDLRFDREAADGVYEKWIRSWHAEPSSNRYSRVLVLDDDVAGFFMFELLGPFGAAGDAVARIVLNGVEPSRAGRGSGFKMYCDALDFAGEVARYATTTVAAANPAVLNLYAKLGFRLTSSGEVTMHWWSED